MTWRFKQVAGLMDLPRHEASSEVDVVGLLLADRGIAFTAAAAEAPNNRRWLGIEDVNLEWHRARVGTFRTSAESSRSTIAGDYRI